MIKRPTMMKQQFLMMLIFLAFHASAFAKTDVNEKINLSPEMVEFYEIQPLPKASLEQNLYIWGVGLSYPHDDYYEVGRKIAEANYLLGQEMKSGQLENWDIKQRIRYVNDYIVGDEELLRFNHIFTEQNGRRRINVCNRYDDDNCIQATLNDAEQIAILNQENSILRERYESISSTINKSVGYFHPYSFADAAYPDITSLISLIDLDAANAVLDLSLGHRDKGVERLERISFLANLSHNGTLTLPLLQLNIQQALNQTINALLNEGLIEADDPFLMKLYSQDINRFDHKIRSALKWQAKAMMQNNLYLYQDYKDKLLDVVRDEQLDLEDEKKVAEFLYRYYKTYEASLEQTNIDPQFFQQKTPKIDGLPFNIYLASPYEYLMQAKYQKMYELLLRAKIKVLKGEALNEDDHVELDEENSILYINFDEGLEEGSPLLPQPIRWFNQGRQFLGRLEVAIPKVK
jgi:hypothetical protein